uniref:Histone deacetylase domain-containing protein n=1 Tax=Strigops habroptila TaxID=2489341 RepID=A0A672UVD1_STRHB
MASGTALIYDEEMTTHKLLWSDPVCDIEVPERLSSSYEQLKCYHLVERCVHVPAREGSEEEILLVHSLGQVSCLCFLPASCAPLPWQSMRLKKSLIEVSIT